MARFTLVEKLAGINSHRFTFLMAADWARDYGIERDIGHMSITSEADYLCYRVY